MLTDKEKKQLDKIAELLAKSPLDEQIKKIIAENFDKLNSEMITKLEKALETEEKGLENIVSDIEHFLKQQDKDWAKLEKKQDELADKLVDDYEEKIIAQIQDK